MNEGYELQVLAGAQQGARTPLPAGTAVSVSGVVDSDVVLRGAGGERRITLAAEGETLLLHVVEGEAEAAGQRFAAGQSATLALATPVAIGDARIVVVRSGGAAETPPAAAPRPAAPAFPARRWSRRLATGGGAVAAVSIGVLAFAYNAAPAGPTPAQQALRAEAVLHGAGLQRLSARTAGNGTVRVDGYLDTHAQRVKAEQLLGAEGIAAQWQVFVNEQVASAVQDVFRVNGVQARVEAVGPGAVRVSAQVADGHLLDSLRGIAKRDVPGLAAIDVRNDPLPAVAAATPAIDDPGKRVSAVVPGETPYVVTADGTRYFQGAMLPTGHRIAGIEERRVVLEINGVQTPLLF
jgi:type III secretion protein D